MEQIKYEDFEKLEIRCGHVIDVKPSLKAKKPSFKLLVDFGEFGVKKSSSQLTELYNEKTLMGKNVVAVTNFPPRQVADFISEVLILGAMDETGKVTLITTDADVPLGTRIL